MIRTVQITNDLRERKDVPSAEFNAFNASFSNELAVDADRPRINDFRLPFIHGQTNRVHIKGSTVDWCDSVEICRKDTDEIMRTIPGSDLKRYNPGGENNEGNLEFNILASDLPSPDHNFNIRIRFPDGIMGGGFDRLDCKVTARGTITSIEWIGDNIPVRAGAARTSYLKAETDFILRFNGSGFAGGNGFGGFGQRFFDRSSTNLFNRANLTVTNLTCNSDGTSITLSFNVGTVTNNSSVDSNFNLTNQLATLDIFASIPIAFHVIGHLPGGWGKYVYHRFAANLPNNGNFTNLGDIKIRTADFFEEFAEIPNFGGEPLKILFSDGESESREVTEFRLACGALGANAFKFNSNLKSNGQTGLTALADLVRPPTSFFFRVIRVFRRLFTIADPPSRFSGLKISMDGNFEFDSGASDLPCSDPQKQVYIGNLTLEWNGGSTSIIKTKMITSFKPVADALMFGKIVPNSRISILPGTVNNFIATFVSVIPARGETEPAKFIVQSFTIHSAWQGLGLRSE